MLNMCHNALSACFIDCQTTRHWPGGLSPRTHHHEVVLRLAHKELAVRERIYMLVHCFSMRETRVFAALRGFLQPRCLCGSRSFGSGTGYTTPWCGCAGKLRRSKRFACDMLLWHQADHSLLTALPTGKQMICMIQLQQIAAYPLQPQVKWLTSPLQ